MTSVVLADDNEDYRFLVGLALGSSSEGGFEVVGEAADGEEALAAVRSLQPDLLLLDLSMPRLDGLSVLDRIAGASPRTAVIVLSGFTAQRMAAEATARGAIGYIEKGVTPNDLIHRVLALLEASSDASA